MGLVRTRDVPELASVPELGRAYGRLGALGWDADDWTVINISQEFFGSARMYQTWAPIYSAVELLKQRASGLSGLGQAEVVAVAAAPTLKALIGQSVLDVGKGALSGAVKGIISRVFGGGGDRPSQKDAGKKAAASIISETRAALNKLNAAIAARKGKVYAAAPKTFADPLQAQLKKDMDAKRKAHTPHRWDIAAMSLAAAAGNLTTQVLALPAVAPKAAAAPVAKPVATAPPIVTAGPAFKAVVAQSPAVNLPGTAAPPASGTGPAPAAPAAPSAAMPGWALPAILVGAVAVLGLAFAGRR